MDSQAEQAFLDNAYRRLRERVASRSREDRALPPPTAAESAATRAGLISRDFEDGRGPEATVQHLLDDVVPGLNGQNLCGRYYGFVTGSCLPIAQAADNVVSALDQNVQVHLPGQSVCTVVENAALDMLVGLLDLGTRGDWPGRTFTTGATASNILGLACGRESVVTKRLRRLGKTSAGVGELGLIGACREADIKEIQVLTSMGHSSLYKAASVVGLGRSAVKELRLSSAEPWRIDIDAVRRHLKGEGVASIIVISAGEVNTGRFATLGHTEMQELRDLADQHETWIHVDGAFGIFARALPDSQSDKSFSLLRSRASGLELADSITADGHKLLNVPYDAGIFLCRDVEVQKQAFTNANACYLCSTGSSEIHSPLNVGLENSRRFRALPVYATLISEGRNGMTQILARMALMARRIAEYIRDSPDYELLPDQKLEELMIIVLFRAKRDDLNELLVSRINETRKMYVSGTSWDGRKAVRIAVSSWRVDQERDFPVVKGVLESVAARR